MKNSSKTVAALALSMLVFPGTGHFLLGRYVRGVIWAAVFGLVLVVMLGIVGVNAGKIADGMMSPTGDVPIDTKQVTTLALLGLSSFLVWGLAGLDTFLLARKLPAATSPLVGERSDTVAPEAPPPFQP